MPESAPRAGHTRSIYPRWAAVFSVLEDCRLDPPTGSRRALIAPGGPDTFRGSAPGQQTHRNQGFSWRKKTLWTSSCRSPSDAATSSSPRRSTGVPGPSGTTALWASSSSATSRTDGGPPWSISATTSRVSTRPSSCTRASGRRLGTSRGSPTPWWSARTVTAASGPTCPRSKGGSARRAAPRTRSPSPGCSTSCSRRSWGRSRTPPPRSTSGRRPRRAST